MIFDINHNKNIECFHNYKLINLNKEFESNIIKAFSTINLFNLLY